MVKRADKFFALAYVEYIISPLSEMLRVSCRINNSVACGNPQEQRLQSVVSVFLSRDRFRICYHLHSIPPCISKGTVLMKNKLQSAIVFVTVLSMSMVNGEDSKVELAKFNGTWELLSVITDGKETPPENLKSVRVVIKDGKHTVFIGQTVVAKEIPFTIDVSRGPKTMVDTLPDGKTIKGIYKLEGETLTSCVADAGQDHPKEFLSKPGSGYTLRVFKRCDEGKQSIEGIWLPTGAELAGAKLPVESLKNWKLTLKPEQYLFENGKEADQGNWKLDTSKTPNAIDITGTEGPNKGKTILAIYELSKDELKVCYDLSGKNRPTEFSTKAGTPLFLVTYKRK